MERMTGEVDGEYPSLGGFHFGPTPPLSYSATWTQHWTVISKDIECDRRPLTAYSHLLSSGMLARLSATGVSHLFPVQTALIPELLSPARSPFPPGDICVSAPTGSGKTLAYVVPVLEALAGSDGGRGRIRAVVVTPVVDLARQVYHVFLSLLDDGAPLKVALMTGQRDMESEMEGLYEGTVPKADIVVATPGRLLEHLNESGGAFCLSYLRFLVVDEADRLVGDRRVDWLGAIERAVYDPSVSPWFFGEKRSSGSSRLIRRYRPNGGAVDVQFSAGRYPLRKVFLSATLSYDPAHLQRLNLYRPNLFQAEEAAGGVVLPSGLTEFTLTCSSKSKPLALYCLLMEHEGDWSRVLCFVNTRQTSRRLVFILSRLGLANVKEASAGLIKLRRGKLVKALADGRVRVLICSDLLARGIDIPRVDCVINYDPPSGVLAYVHRAGRTGRAGCPGAVVTMLNHQQVDQFKGLMDWMERWSGVQKLETPVEKMRRSREAYREALSQLKLTVRVGSVSGH